MTDTADAILFEVVRHRLAAICPRGRSMVRRNPRWLALRVRYRAPG